MASPALTSRMEAAIRQLRFLRVAPGGHGASTRDRPARCSGLLDLRHRAPETSMETSRVALVAGGAADDDDSPADNPRPGRNAKFAPNVRTYGEPGDDQRPDRDGRLLDDTWLDDVGLLYDDDRRDDDNCQRQGLSRTASTREGLSFTSRPPTSRPTTATTRTGGGPRSSNLLKRTNIHHRGPRTATDRPATPTDNQDVTWVSPCCLQRMESSGPCLSTHRVR